MNGDQYPEVSGDDAGIVPPQGGRGSEWPKKIRTLTAAELDLLFVLCRNPGRVLSRDHILDLTHGHASVPFDRSVDILISRIRKKIERDPRAPELIVTVRAGGYLFTPAVAAL